MNILHIASLDNNRANGVSIVVPEHVKNQGKIEKLALLNCSGITLDLSNEEINYEMYDKNHCPDGNISSLPKPFNRPDLVVFHGVYYYYFIKVTRYLVKHDIPYIVAPHGSLTSFAQRKKYIKKFFGNLIYFNRFIKYSAAIQYLTSKEQEMSSSFENNNFVCGNGMYVRGNNIVKNEKKKKQFQLTFIGRLDPFHKGLDILIEACEKISTDMREHNIHLSIFGPDHQGGKKFIESKIKSLGIEEIVSVGEALYGEDKQKQLEDTDVFVLTSRFEGQPLAAMEALAMGIPVILTPGTNMADDVLKYECGWKANFSTQDISLKILEAFNSRKKFNQLSKNALNLVNSNYSWDSIAEKNIEEFKSILMEKSNFRKENRK